MAKQAPSLKKQCPEAHRLACELCETFVEKYPVGCGAKRGSMYNALYNHLVLEVCKVVSDQLKIERASIKKFISTQLKELRFAKSQPKMVSSAKGVAGAARPLDFHQERKQAIRERAHTPERYALNLTGQRMVEKMDRYNAINRAKLREEHDAAMLVRPHQKSPGACDVCCICVTAFSLPGKNVVNT